MTRHHFRTALTYAALTAAMACEPERPPVVAVAMGASEMDGVVMAFETPRDALPFDTIIRYILTSRAAPALEIAREVIATPNVIGVVGHSNSGASLATAPLYNQHRIVQLSPNSTATAYSDAGPYSFRLVPPDAEQARFLAAMIAANFRGQTAALLYENDEYGRALRSELLSAMPAGAIDWVIDSPHLEGADSASTEPLAAAVVAAHPDIIVWLGRELTARAWFPHLRRGLGPVPIVGSDALSALVLERDVQLDVTNIWFVDLVDPNATSELRAFSAEFRTRFGHDPMGAQILTYDAIMLFGAGIAEGARTGEELRDWLMSLGRTRPPYQGVSGAIAFDEHGDVIRKHVMCMVGETVTCQ